MSVCLYRGGLHVTVTHDALNLTVQVPQRQSQPRFPSWTSDKGPPIRHGNPLITAPSWTCNGLEFRDYFRIGKTHGWGRCIVYKSSGGKIGDSSGGRGVLPFCMGWTWFKLAVTSSNWFLPVVAHDKWTVWHGLLCHFRFWTITMQMCCWIVDLTYSTLWLICALNYIVKCYWSHVIILCIYWSGLLLWTSTREVV